jgi:hypothetical protein
MTTLEHHEQARLVQQRDDAIDRVKILAPLAQAAVNLAVELDMSAASWWDAYRTLGDLGRRYVDEYGTEVDV